MNIPKLGGIIDRRILLNYRVDADVAEACIPLCFRAQRHAGCAIAGVCLLRLRAIRPVGWPAWTGIDSENAAHRMAVEWGPPERPRRGVYIWRRDSDSRLNVWAGGWLFPGVHRRARFGSLETPRMFEIRVEEPDGRTLLALRARRAAALPKSSVFASLDEACAFFRGGACGYSPAPGGCMQGVELRCRRWLAAPLAVEEAASRFFGNSDAFPRGSIELDSALLMEGVEHEWHALPELDGHATIDVASHDDATEG